MRKPMIALGAAALTMLGVGTASFPAYAQLTRDVGVVGILPNNPNPDVVIEISMDRGEVAIGDRVSFCVTASQSGYLTLWDVGTSGRTTRLYPNSYTGSGIPRINAGEQYCAGDAAHGYVFEVRPPTGMETIYAIWSESPETQPSASEFSNATNLTRDINVTGVNPRAWATAKTSFAIIDPREGSGRVSAPLAFPRAEGDFRDVWVLAFSANVGELSMTDDDARSFTSMMRASFNLDASHVRLLTDAHLSDVRDGFEWLARNARPDDLVLIYYSGHGYTMGDLNGDEADGLDEAYVLMDANHGGWPRAEDVLLDDEFARALARIRTDRILTVIDACFSGGLSKAIPFESARGKSKFLRKSGPGAAPPAIPARPVAGDGIDARDEGRSVFLAAARENQFAQEGVRGGVFTVALTEAIASGRSSTLFSAFEAARRAVDDETGGQQTPTLVGPSALLSDIRLR